MTPDDHVYITRLSSDGRRGWLRRVDSGAQRVVYDRNQATVLPRWQAELFIERGRPDPRYKPAIEDA